MDAVAKTQALDRKFLPISVLIPNTKNPNVMSDAEFNMLADNIEKMGITDPILVRPVEDGQFRVVGGHHRLEVAKVLGFEEVPCTVVTDPTFDEDQEAFQVVRMNVIRGRLSPERFMQMYQGLSSKYSDEIMAESFGFVEEEEFRKLVGQVKKALPKELKKEFEQSAKELKTINDLSKLLNHLFSTYGSTLPYGYMLLDFGGRESVWLRMSTDTKKALLKVGEFCQQESRTVDDIVGGLIRLAAYGQLSQQLVQLIAESEPVAIPENVSMPTAENLKVA